MNSDLGGMPLFHRLAELSLETSPEEPGRQRWSSGVKTLETFCTEHQIEDPVDPFKGVRWNDPDRRSIEAARSNYRARGI